MKPTRTRKAGRRRKSGKLRPFVPMFWDTLNSTAYKELSGMPCKLLPFFLGKPKTSLAEEEAYQKIFSFTYSEAKKLGFATSTFSRALSELIKKGFITPVRKGGLRSDGKQNNLFKLSRKWKDYGEPGFKPLDWKQYVHDDAIQDRRGNGNI